MDIMLKIVIHILNNLIPRTNKIMETPWKKEIITAAT